MRTVPVDTAHSLAQKRELPLMIVKNHFETAPLSFVWFLQSQQLLFLSIKLFLRNDTTIKQFLKLFQFISIAVISC